MADTLSVRLDFTTEDYGALIACVARGAEAVPAGAERMLLSDLEDRLRNAQRQVLGPMSVVEGMRLTRAIQASERAVSAVLRG